jgi:hypothetical protein
MGIESGCAEAALEAFKKANLKWKPWIEDGKRVKVKMV